MDAALRGDWIDDITLSALRGLMPEAAVLAWSRFDPAVESSSGWMPFGRRGWILPRLQLEADEGCHRLVGYLLPGERPEAIEPARASLLVPRRAPVTARMYRQEEDSDFRDLVHGAIEAIQSGDLEKVVLARKVSYALSEPIDAAYVLHQLASGNHYAFLVESGEHAFLGASPERLSRRIGQRLQTEMLAGTVRARSADDAMQLLESSKDRHEHDVVVRSVTERLSSIAETRKNEDQVAVVPAAGGLWHLRRQLELTLNDAVDDASVLGLLHPLPRCVAAPPTWPAPICPVKKGLIAVFMPVPSVCLMDPVTMLRWRFVRFVCRPKWPRSLLEPVSCEIHSLRWNSSKPKPSWRWLARRCPERGEG